MDVGCGPLTLFHISTLRECPWLWRFCFHDDGGHGLDSVVVSRDVQKSLKIQNTKEHQRNVSPNWNLLGHTIWEQTKRTLTALGITFSYNTTIFKCSVLLSVHFSRYYWRVEKMEKRFNSTNGGIPKKKSNFIRYSKNK